MGDCKYCGKPAGFLSSSHKECKENFDAGKNRIMALITIAARDANFISTLKPSVEEIAEKHLITATDISSIIKDSWQEAIDEAFSDNILTEKEESNLTKIQELFELNKDLLSEKKSPEKKEASSKSIKHKFQNSDKADYFAEDSGINISIGFNEKLFEKYSRLQKEATALKNAGRIEDAIKKIKEAYDEAKKKRLHLSAKDYLRLPLYLQKANRNDEGWRCFNELILQFANDYVSLSQIYDKMRLFRQREKAHKDAIQYAILSNLYWCLGLNHQVYELGWDEREEELYNCKENISEGYGKLLKKINYEDLEDDFKKIIIAHMRDFPNISTASLLTDIRNLLN